MDTQNHSGRALLLCAALAACSLTGRAQNLPDAPPSPPTPQEPATPSTHIAVPATRPSSVAALNHRQWSGVVEPDEKIPPMTVHEKLLFPLHEELRPATTLIPILYSGAYGIWRNSDPKYGTNGAAFGKRVGIAALRQGISRELSDSLLPILFRQDPRYYRQAYGTYGSRTQHAIRQIFIIQTDSGSRAFNFSDVLGRGMAASLTQTYYPASSLGAGVVLRTWGVSLAALGGSNLFGEFWPDVKHKVFHKAR